MKRILLLFCTGGIVYPAIEIAWRGKTHISMSLAGGTCLCLIDKICACKMRHRKWTHQCAAGAAVITAVEFLFGVCVNCIGKRNVWDYSKLPGNVMGQICLPFSVCWFFLSAPAIGFCRLCHRSRALSK